MSKIGAAGKQAGAESAGKRSEHAWLCVPAAGPPPSCDRGAGRSVALQLQEHQAGQHSAPAELQSLSLQPLTGCGCLPW